MSVNDLSNNSKNNENSENNIETPLHSTRSKYGPFSIVNKPKNYTFKYLKLPKKIKTIVIISSLFLLLLLIISIYFIVNNKTKINSKLKGEIQKYFDILPSFIKYDSKGNIKLDKSGFKNLSDKKKQYLPLEKIKINKIESNKIYTINGDNNETSYLDISLFHNDLNFKNKIKEMIETSYDHQLYTLVIKKEIGCLEYKIEDIKLDDTFKNEIQTLTNDISLNDTQKAKKLDELFQNHGYFIPLKIYFGGLFTIAIDDIMKSKNNKNLLKLINSDEFTELELNISANYSNNNQDILNELNSLYSFTNKYVVGGDSTKNNFNDWILSINNLNAEIISYDNIIKVTSLLDNDIKLKLDGALKIIDEKYSNRSKYYNTIKKIREIKNNDGEIKKNGNEKYEMGLDDSFNKLIYVKNYTINEEWEFVVKKKAMNISSNDIIVGFKIIPNKQNNGEWILNKNPLLTNTMKIEFISDYFRGLEYTILVCAIKLYE